MVLAKMLLMAALFAPCTAFAAPAAGAKPPIVILPGERITLGGSGLDLRVTAAGPAPADAEGEPARHGESEHIVTVPLSFHAAPGTVVFTLWDDADNGARLKLENGLDRPIVYAAELTYRVDGKSDRTTICSIQPKNSGLESWPDDLISIRILGFYDAPTGAQVCGYADRGDLGAPPQN